MAEWQLTAFTAYELGWPSKPAKLATSLGAYAVSGEQYVCFLNLVEDNVRFCRLGRKALRSDPGRGLATLQGLLQEFESTLKSADHVRHYSPQANLAGAMAVDTTRIAIPKSAGRIHPEELLPEH